MTRVRLRRKKKEARAQKGKNSKKLGRQGLSLPRERGVKKIEEAQFRGTREAEGPYGSNCRTSRIGGEKTAASTGRAEKKKKKGWKNSSPQPGRGKKAARTRKG